MSSPASRDVLIRRAPLEHAEEIASLIRRAFRVQAELYDDLTLPPLLETDRSVAAAMAAGVVLEAVDEDGELVGTVRGELTGDVCHVARLAVSPRRQGAGLGAVLVKALEAEFPQAERFEMFTGHRSDRALHIYESLGYRRVRIEPVNSRLELVYLEKRRDPR